MSDVKLWTLQSPESQGEPFNIQPATPEEIKAAHPKCATCEYKMLNKYNYKYVCSHGTGINNRILDVQADYCRHHTPSEGDEGREGGRDE